MKIYKHIYLSILFALIGFTSNAQNVDLTGSCFVSSSTLVLGGDISTPIYNGYPVYYNAAVTVNYLGTPTTVDAYLYYELAANLGTPENRWVIALSGQPYYYVISNASTAPTGGYLPFDTTATTSACGGTLTVSPTCVSITTPTFTAIAPICNGSTAPILPTTSIEGITGTWSPAIVDNTTTGTYTFTPDAGQCATTATMNITVNPNVLPTFSSVAPICSGDNLSALPTTSDNGITGTWSPALNNTTTTTYTFTPDTGICATTATMTIVVNPLPTITCPGNISVCEGQVVNYTVTTNSNISVPFTQNTNSTPVVGGGVSCGTGDNTFYRIYDLGALGYSNGLLLDTIKFSVEQSSAISRNVTVSAYTLNGAFNNANLTLLGSTIVPITNASLASYSASMGGLTVPGNSTLVVAYSVASDSANFFYPGGNLDGQSGVSYIETNDCGFSEPIDLASLGFTQAIIIDFDARVIGSGVLTLNSGFPSGSIFPLGITTVSYTSTSTEGCQSTCSFDVTVNPNITPTFATIAPVCAGDALSVLPTTSDNGITGTWSPALDNTTTTTYIFTPDAGQCAATATMTIVVNPLTTNTTTISACDMYTWSVDGNTYTTSGMHSVVNGCDTQILDLTITPSTTNTTTISACDTYTWSVDGNTYTTSGTHTVVNGCDTQILDLTISPTITPTFTTVAPICPGSIAPTLPTTSNEGITGTWSPATVDNTTTGTYTFTPDAGQCATVTTLTIDVISFGNNDYGTGTDGVYHASSDTTLAGGTYNYTTFTIDSGVTVNVTGSQPLVIKTTGAVNINGILSANGGNGNDGVTFSNGGNGGIAVAGGGNGGNGTYSSSNGPLDGSNGDGDGGVNTFGSGWSGGGGAGYATTGLSSGGVGGFGGPIYGLPTIDTQTAGSGGGGGSGGYGCGSGGGGAGGGFIKISGTTISIGAIASINTNGGNGGSDGNGNCGGGGGGSGGTIWLITNNLLQDGNLNSLGGLGGASTVSGNPYYGTGGDGAIGRIKLEYNTITTTGVSSPAPFVSVFTSATIPTFTAIAPICSGDALSPLPTTSDNGITGTWSPALDNTTTTTYTFTPDAGQCATTTTMTIVVNPIPVITGFTANPFPICEGSSTVLGVTVNNSPTLNFVDSSSANQSFIMNTAAFGTPLTAPLSGILVDAGSNGCAAFAPGSLAGKIALIQRGTCTFATKAQNAQDAGAIGVILYNNAAGSFIPGGTAPGVTIPVYAITQANGLALIASMSGGQLPITLSPAPPLTYLWSTGDTTSTTNTGVLNTDTDFTVTVTNTLTGCSVQQTVTVPVTPNVIPTFTALAPICAGSIAPTLPATSNEGITGTWSPVTVDNTTTGTYTFTPTPVAGQCLGTATMTIVVNPSTTNTTTITACDTYTWAIDGNTYTTSGTHTVVNGCDTQILNLTITPSTINTTTISTCGSYTWNGTTYTATGLYTGTTTNCVTEKLDLTITPTAQPIAMATQIYAGSGTLADLTVTGTNIQWYDAATSGTILPTSTSLVDGTTYYASQTVSTCESQTRVAVIVRKISEATQTLCSTAYVSDLLTTPSVGSTASWFTTPAGGTALPSSTVLSNGIYYVEQSSVDTLPLGSGFYYPYSVALDASGTIYVADTANNAIKKMDANGNNIVTLGSGFNTPLGIAIDATGSIYVADTYNNLVKKMDNNGNNITVLGTFNHPVGITLDGLGHIFVTNTNSNEIIKMNTDGSNATTLASGLLSNPLGIAVDAAGNIYVADFGTNTVKKMDSNGNNITTIGSGYNGPFGMAVDTLNNVYVTDQGNSLVIKMDSNGGNPTNLGSGFSHPDGVAIDTNGVVFVADTAGQAIKKIVESTSNRVAVDIVITPSTTNTTTISACGSYTWSVDGNTYTTSGTHTVVNGCDTQILDLTINTTTTPTPTGSTSQTLLDTDTIANIVVNPTTVIWYPSLADALAGTNALTSTTVVTNGTTYYAVDASGTCPSAPLAVTITTTLSRDGFDDTNFSYSPNPTSNVLNIRYSKMIDDVTVTNLLGQIILNKKTNNTEVQIDLSNLAEATYFVKVVSEGKEKIVKVIKK